MARKVDLQDIVDWLELNPDTFSELKCGVYTNAFIRYYNEAGLDLGDLRGFPIGSSENDHKYLIVKEWCGVELYGESDGIMLKMVAGKNCLLIYVNNDNGQYFVLIDDNGIEHIYTTDLKVDAVYFNNVMHEQDFVRLLISDDMRVTGGVINQVLLSHINEGDDITELCIEQGKHRVANRVNNPLAVTAYSYIIDSKIEVIDPVPRGDMEPDETVPVIVTKVNNLPSFINGKEYSKKRFTLPVMAVDHIKTSYKDVNFKLVLTTYGEVLKVIGTSTEDVICYVTDTDLLDLLAMLPDHITELEQE